MCDPCLFPTMPPNKALQMDPHASRLVTAANTMLYHWATGTLHKYINKIKYIN